MKNPAGLGAGRGLVFMLTLLVSSA